jgi:hypothetical protein
LVLVVFSPWLLLATTQVRIPCPKIDKLACQAHGVGITKRSGVTLSPRSISGSMPFTPAPNTARQNAPQANTMTVCRLAH